MKKLVTYFTALFTAMAALWGILTLAACSQGQAVQDPLAGGALTNQAIGEQETSQTDDTQGGAAESLPVSYEYRAQYVRTDGYHSDVTYPMAFLIDSRAALDRYYVDNVDRYNFSYSSTKYFDGSLSFDEAIQTYDDKWFESHCLILALLEEGSGSVRHKVVNVSRTTENDITVEIIRYSPQMHTDDMAEWHILIGMDRDDLQSADQFQVICSKTERMFDITLEEGEKIQNMLSSAENCGFLHSSYKSPENIDWSKVFYGGAGIATTDLSDQEKEDYVKAVGSNYSYGDIYKITAKQLEEFISEKTNSSYQDALRPFQWTYLEQYDAYYADCWDTHIDSYQYQPFGIRMGDTLKFRVKRNKVNDWEPEEIYELVLQEKSDGSYYFVSNRLCWEEGRLAEQSFFDVELSEYDTPVQVMIYPPAQEDNSNFVIRMIKDDEVVEQITPWLPDGVEDGRFISMDAVAFPDYDMDGDTDMILIYTIEGGRVIDILDGYDLRNLSWQSGFEHNLDLANAIMQRTEEEVNMTNVKKFLGYQGKGEKFSSWQEAYRFIARLENIQQPLYQYNLIYFDEDEVPELVVDLPGRVSLYTYADGQLYRLMDGWGYGALGNVGYEYIPRKNKMFNRDNDYAGAVYYDTITRMNSDHHMEDAVTILTVNFDDKNGDGYPEEDEVQTLGEVSTSYIDDRIISEEEYASYFTDAEEAEWISGEFRYEELLQMLGK